MIFGGAGQGGEAMADGYMIKRKKIANVLGIAFFALIMMMLFPNAQKVLPVGSHLVFGRAVYAAEAAGQTAEETENAGKLAEETENAGQLAEEIEAAGQTADETENAGKLAGETGVETGQTADETETEAGHMAEWANTTLPDEVRDEVMSMSNEELETYAIQIMSIINNPDFQALFEYEDVRDLTVMLMHNALEFAKEDPELTDEILETMGVDRKAILLFFALLDAQENHGDKTDKLLNFIASDTGEELMSSIYESLDDEQTQMLLQSFSKLMESAENVGLIGGTESTEQEEQTEQEE